MSHTPGPWIARCDDQTEGLKRGDNGIRFWSIRGEGKYRGDMCTVHAAEHIGGVTIDERDANARLIAAAPELLEALQGLVGKSTDTPGDWSREWNAALAAIAKATGAAA